MTSSASVDLRRRQFVASSSSRTTGGTRIANGAFQVLQEGVSDPELGAAVAAMLAASKTGIPMPNLRNAPSPFAPVLEHLKLRSYGAYLKGTRHVEVEQEGTAVVVTPYHNGGTREGFVGMPDRAVRLENPDPAGLGRAVGEALAAAT